MHKILTQMVEVKWILSGNGTVQSRFEKTGPYLAVLVRPTFIALADACHS